MEEIENIYRICRLRAKENLGKEHFGSSEKAAQTLGMELSCGGLRENCHVSYASVKDYESGKSIPTPETVELMADVYQTPELKWLHCAYSCPLGKRIAHARKEIGTGDIYRTYFELVGAFDLVDSIEKQLHGVIADDRIDEGEELIVDDILSGLDRIAECSKELRIWAERQKVNLRS